MKYVLGLLVSLGAISLSSVAWPLGILMGVFVVGLLSRTDQLSDFDASSTLDPLSNDTSDLSSNDDDLFESASLFDDSEFNYSTTDSSPSTDDDLAINPASGLPMTGGIGGVDAAGNPYGIDSSDTFDDSSLFDDTTLFEDSSISSFSDTDSFDDSFGIDSSDFDDPFS